ncbi:MAG: hypothetical protein QOK25_2895, partial [Thermoleophilaceae bacterium]|nr:hypothetical protein [Thermoleophilaceae bacterium]
EEIVTVAERVGLHLHPVANAALGREPAIVDGGGRILDLNARRWLTGRPSGRFGDGLGLGAGRIHLTRKYPPRRVG